MAGTLGTVQPFRYRGYVYDEETELYYLLTRFFKCEWGRFISSDSLTCHIVGDLKNRNLFTYCDNYPVACIDSEGQFGLTILGVMAIGGLIGGLVSAAFELGNQVLNEKEDDVGTIAANVGVAFVSGFFSGALNASPAGKGVQIIGGAVISGVTYWASCEVNNESFDTSECVISCGTGAFFGWRGGDGLTHKSSPLRVAMDTGKSQVARELRRRNQEYAARQMQKIQQGVIKTTLVTSIRPFSIYVSGAYLSPKIKDGIEPWCESIEDMMLPDSERNE